MQAWNSAAIVALVWSLVPVLAFGFVGNRIVRASEKLPLSLRLVLPALFGIPYLLVASTYAHWSWVLLYFTLPVLVATLLWRARQSDPQQKGDWRDFAILLLLGLAVDLRWFEPAWPAHFKVINKLILLDAGLYSFLLVRQVTNVGFDLRLRAQDLMTGVRELLFYAPIAVPLGLALGFLRWHARVPRPSSAALTWMFTFLFIAVPEEVYFRGWMQNLLERRLGRNGSLWLTAAIFGVSHFNKRAASFNWRYVLLAAVAGFFYGRAWRSQHRVAASAVTHACVDTIWSLWLT